MSINHFGEYLLSLGGRKRALAVPASKGMSIYSFAVVPRKNKDREIDGPELQSAVSQAIWRIFDEARQRLGRRLGISELDVILLSARIMSVKIDGFRVMNPLGFTGSKIELEIGQTLAERDFVDVVSSRLSKDEEINLFFHPASAHARLIREESGQSGFILAEFHEGKTRLYRVEDGGGIDYLSDFDWDDEKFVSGVADFINVPEEAGRQIVVRYFQGNLSSGFSKQLKNIFSDFFQGFHQGIEAAFHNAKIKKTAIYVASRLFGRADKKVLRYPSSSPDIRFILPPRKEEIAFWEADLAETNVELNKLARQRVRWLVAGK
jgi:hypothetical protein